MYVQLDVVGYISNKDAISFGMWGVWKENNFLVPESYSFTSVTNHKYWV